MFFHQATIRLKARPRGYHLVTREIVAGLPELDRLHIGFLHLFLQHTSASLQINENADPDVREDFERWSNQAVPDGAAYFVHTAEGDDDMPSHIKSVLTQVSVSVPILDGKLALGTWQGIYLWEHRDRPTPREILVSTY